MQLVEKNKEYVDYSDKISMIKSEISEIKLKVKSELKNHNHSVTDEIINLKKLKCQENQNDCKKILKN